MRSYIDAFHELDAETQSAVMKWISKYIHPIETVNRKHTSYGLKHMLQSDTGIYLKNEQFKGAMIEAGLLPYFADEHNWRFRISEKYLRSRKERDTSWQENQ